MALSEQDVQSVAALARLELSADELIRMTEQMNQIVDYVALLEEVETSDVAPMAHALDVANVFAVDEVRPSLPRDEALANAPSRDDECYRVPPVLGE
ncbi:MAG: Asp-tRNA(Asn)/Glu-tRNA(Gln) amidotransferase subunit GatC [Pirellulaceae bacterium]|nr:Asp-tRNA(Asn)/Glu-tRNA(Gln) amidotransferase subunit GatC [Pirellulaceae bacterium]